jgi:hypothetical protein
VSVLDAIKDATGRSGEEIDSNDANEGAKADKCAAAAAKVARQPKGSARRRMAQRELDRCREAQSTDSNQ